jgi:N-acyl homoserine lactone hydrolase
VLIDGGDWQVLYAGDILYTLRHLAVDVVQPIMLGKRARTEQLASIEQIRELRRSRPGLAVIPGHDHTEYGHALVSVLRGSPSAADWESVRAVERAQVDQVGNAVEPSLPRYVAPPATARSATWSSSSVMRRSE